MAKKKKREEYLNHSLSSKEREDVEKEELLFSLKQRSHTLSKTIKTYADAQKFFDSLPLSKRKELLDGFIKGLGIDVSSLMAGKKFGKPIEIRLPYSGITLFLVTKAKEFLERNSFCLFEYIDSQEGEIAYRVSPVKLWEPPRSTKGVRKIF